MELSESLAALSALAHEQRLGAFRLLVQAEPGGLIAGEIAAALAVPATTLSNNLSILSAAGLIRSRREGRAIRYFACLPRMGALLDYLTLDCCGGRPELCFSARHVTEADS